MQRPRGQGWGPYLGKRRQSGEALHEAGRGRCAGARGSQWGSCQSHQLSVTPHALSLGGCPGAPPPASEPRPGAGALKPCPQDTESVNQVMIL